MDFSKGTTYIQRLGNVNKLDALTVGYLVPTVVGREPLKGISCFKRILEECVNVVDTYGLSKTKKLSEVLQGAKL